MQRFSPKKFTCIFQWYLDKKFGLYYWREWDSIKQLCPAPEFSFKSHETRYFSPVQLSENLWGFCWWKYWNYQQKIEFDNKLKEYFLNDLAAVISCNCLLSPCSVPLVFFSTFFVDHVWDPFDFALPCPAPVVNTFSLLYSNQSVCVSVSSGALPPLKSVFQIRISFQFHADPDPGSQKCSYGSVSKKFVNTKEE